MRPLFIVVVLIAHKVYGLKIAKLSHDRLVHFLDEKFIRGSVFPSPGVSKQDKAILSAGWLNEYNYASTSCSGNVLEQLSVITNMCLSLPESVFIDGDYFGSALISCSSGFASLSLYPDTECHTVVHPYLVPTNMCYSQPDIAAGGFELTCTSSVPATQIQGVYFTESIFTGSTCDDSTLIQTSAFQQNHCFGADYEGQSGSAQFIAPYIYAYEGDACVTSNTTHAVTLPLDYCAALSDVFPPIPTNDDTAVPASMNIYVKFLSSDGIVQNYEFQATQTLVGISQSTYQADMNANNAAIAYTVANAIAGMSASQVVVNSVVASVASSVDVTVSNRNLQTGTSCVVTYTVSYNIADIGYPTEPMSAYTFIVTTLNAYIMDASFNTALQGYASTHGITDMSAVTSDTFSCTGYIAEPDSTDTSGNSNASTDLSTPALAGVVIGGIAFALIAFAGGWFCFYSKSRSSPTEGVQKAGTKSNSSMEQGDSLPHAIPTASPITNPIAATGGNVK